MYRLQVHISYLEIYNEVGYDLLDPDREVKGIEDLPQVSLSPGHEQRYLISYLDDQMTKSSE